MPRPHFGSFAKPLLRKFLKFACLLLATVAAALWARSYSLADRYRWTMIREASPQIFGRNIIVMSGRGGIGFFFEQIQTSDPVRIQRLKRSLRAVDFRLGYSTAPSPEYPLGGAEDETLLQAMGIYFFHGSLEQVNTLRRRFAIVLPFWLIFCTSVAYPVGGYVWGVLRRHRAECIALGMCPSCGTQLNGQPRCPGCNRPATAIQQV